MLGKKELERERLTCGCYVTMNWFFESEYQHQQILLQFHFYGVADT